MSITSLRRSRAYAIAFLALVGALLVPASAAADTEMSRSFEVGATANYVVNVDCGDGSTVQQRVTVIAGHEEESESGEDHVRERLPHRPHPRLRLRGQLHQ